MPDPVSLEKIAKRVAERDWIVLKTLVQFHFATTRQLAGFAFDSHDGGIPRRVNHALGRLRGLGLLTNLERRIGGVRAGSAGHVWVATDQAHRLLAWREGRASGTRIRVREPSAAFLEHTLAVTEIALTLTTPHAGWTVRWLETEPTSWRSYLGPAGMPIRLKPDLAAATSTGSYDDIWFLEIDRDTEPPSRIIRKSLEYQSYRLSRHEQDRHGVFPGVIWIVPNARRREQLARFLTADQRIDQRLFAVITPDELPELIRAGINNFQGGQEGGTAS